MTVHPLLAILQQRGLTQSALAERAGVSKSHISDIIRGRRVPGREALRRIAVALGMTPGELFDVLVGASPSSGVNVQAPGDETQSVIRDIASRGEMAA